MLRVIGLRAWPCGTWMTTLLFVAGCMDPKCPSGYEQRGDKCYRIKDGGPDAAGLEEVESDGGEQAAVDPSSSQLDATVESGADDAGSRVALDAIAPLDGQGEGAAPDAAEPGGDTGAVLPQVDANVELAPPDASAPARPCELRPCQNGGICSAAGEGHSCACVDGYTGPNCELEICGDVSIRTRADVENNRLCAEIHGSLDIAAVGLPAITEDDFPFLTKIAGQLVIGGAHGGGSSNLQTVTLATLKIVEGAISIIGTLENNSGPLAELHLPALETIGDTPGELALFVSNSTIRVLDLPAVETLSGGARLMFLPELCTLNLRKLTRVGGGVTASEIPRLSVSALEALRTAATGSAVTEVGCCWPSTNDRIACSALRSGCAGCPTP